MLEGAVGETPVLPCTDKLEVEQLMDSAKSIGDALIILPYKYDRGLDLKLKYESYVYVVENENTRLCLSRARQMFGRSSRRMMRSKGKVCSSKEVVRTIVSFITLLENSERAG